MSDTYVCAECGQKFSKCRSDEDAWDEASGLFGDKITESEPFVVVCDPCWRKLGFGQ